LTQKQEIISELISKLFSGNFCEFEKTGYFQKFQNFEKPNYSETHENKKFRKFCLTQGFIVRNPAIKCLLEAIKISKRNLVLKKCKIVLNSSWVQYLDLDLTRGLIQSELR